MACQPPARGRMVDQMVPPNDKPPPPARRSVPTPYLDPDDALLMVDPTALTRLASVEAAMEIGVRPVVASRATYQKVAAMTRPLVIVVEAEHELDMDDLTDLAVSVGAQLVLVKPNEVGPDLAKRVELAGKASKNLRSRRP